MPRLKTERSHNGRRPIGPAEVAMGQRIKDRREQMKMIQEELAAAVGKSPAMVGHWESGYVRISAIELLGLARTLNCTVGYLTGELEYSVGSADDDWLSRHRARLALIAPGAARDVYKKMLNTQSELAEAVLRVMQGGK